MVPDGSVDTAIQAYWEDPSSVSIIDKNLHQLEIEVARKHLLPSDYLADIGCGNGQATVHYAARVRKCLAIERSNRLRQQAVAAACQSGLSNLQIRAGDILTLDGMAEEFDAIITQRMLINLTSWEAQQQALTAVHRMLKVGGRYIMIENTNDAFLTMNDYRHEVGLSPVPQHWHNRFFDFDQLMDFMNDRFQLLKNYDFGLYYFLTRVYVPMFASFVGYGSKAIKDPIYEKADEAARTVFETFADRVRVTGCRAFGPIQVFVFRREA